MRILFYLWYLFAGLIAVVWIGRYIAIRTAIRKRIMLSSRSYDSPPDPAPKVSVLVAAKDEEDNIETCITTLLDQDYPDYEVIAIDDRSEDRTPEILQRLESQAEGKLRVVTIKQLRKGWFGKNNAMREGVSIARGDFMMFTDADCRQVSNKTISVSMRELLEHDTDFLSITPVLETKTILEKILQPVCALILMMWFPPYRVNDPERKAAYANGAFMLLRRKCYDGIGGHDRVKTEVNEDILMAQHAKRMGFNLRLAENDDLYRTRMYRNFPETFRGWSRIFYGSLRTSERLTKSIVMILMFTVLPWTSMTIALVGRTWSSPEHLAYWTWAIWAWAGVIAIKQMSLWKYYSIVRIPRGWSLTYAIGASLTITMLINAISKVWGATDLTWRGTTYRGSTVEASPGETLIHEQTQKVSTINVNERDSTPTEKVQERILNDDR